MPRTHPIKLISILAKGAFTQSKRCRKTLTTATATATVAVLILALLGYAAQIG
jgi:hypothetical protein